MLLVLNSLHRSFLLAYSWAIHSDIEEINIYVRLGRSQVWNLTFQYHIYDVIAIWVNKIFTERLNCVLVIKVGSTKMISICFGQKAFLYVINWTGYSLFPSQPFHDYTLNRGKKKCSILHRTNQPVQILLFSRFWSDYLFSMTWRSHSRFCWVIVIVGCEVHKSSLCL